MKSISCFGVVWMLGAALLLGQAPVEKNDVKPPAAPVNVACNAAAVDGSGMSECEQLRMETILLQQNNAQLQQQVSSLQNALLEAQKPGIEQQRRQFVMLMQGQHLGMTYEPPSQQFQLGRWVPLPPNPKALPDAAKPLLPPPPPAPIDGKRPTVPTPATK